MKKLILSLFVVAISYTTTAQKKVPASPAQKIEQTVGFTTITVEYSRPGVKDRTIFGELIPFGEVWRTGANQNTKITFSTDVTVGDVTKSRNLCFIGEIQKNGMKLKLQQKFLQKYNRFQILSKHLQFYLMM